MTDSPDIFVPEPWLDRAREMADDPDPRMARRGTEILEGDL